MSYLLFGCGLTVLTSLPSFAEQATEADKPAAKIQRANPPGGPNVIPIERPKQPRAPAQIPDALTNRLMNMTPEQREKALANLPQNRRDGIQKRLERLDQLPDDEKARLNQRF